ncbi:MAG: membrane protein insertase YidC [Candidatus Terrybacteria bacterium]|nr:membrane protein insertase YidC [Candidatus Terrybacteria bacterium]
MISLIFNNVFYEPFLNGLIWLIDVLPFHDVGLSVIILTLAIRFLIFPLTHRATVTQIKIKQLEPDLKNIKEKFKSNSQEQAKKTMELYRRHGINPFSGFLTLLIQIPVFFALYKIFTAGFNFDFSHLYSFISMPENINLKFLGLFDMTKNSYVLAFLTGLTQFIQMRLALPPVKKEPIAKASFKNDFARSLNLQMRYIMPVFIFFIVSRLSSAIGLYWTTMNIFAIVHETIVRKKAGKIYGTANKNNQIISGGGSGENDSQRRN